jgi:hypothetical protein
MSDRYAETYKAAKVIISERHGEISPRELHAMFPTRTISLDKCRQLIAQYKAKMAKQVKAIVAPSQSVHERQLDLIIDQLRAVNGYLYRLVAEWERPANPA